MIRLSGRDEKTGRGVIIFGIDAENVKRLKEGKPIRVDASEMGFDGTIVIHYEETLEKLEAAFGPLIGPTTRVRDFREGE